MKIPTLAHPPSVPARRTLSVLLALGLTQLAPAATEPGVRWEPSGYQQSEESIYDMARNPAGLIVAVGRKGTILSSSDEGLTWTRQECPTRGALRSILWTGTRWLAASGYSPGSALSSPDSVNWSITQLGDATSLDYLLQIGPQIVASGWLGAKTFTLHESEHGDSWTSSPGDPYAFRDCISTGTKYLAVDLAGDIRSSVDGSTWTLSHSSPTVTFSCIATSGSRIVAMGSLTDSPFTLVAAHSTGGLTWTEVPIGDNNTGWPTDILWTGSSFVAAPTAQNGSPLFTSPDGLTWNQHELPGSAPDPSLLIGSSIKCLCWTGSRLIAGSHGGYIATAETGAPDSTSDWTIRQARGTWAWNRPILEGVCAFDDGGTTRLVTAGTGGAILTSDDEGLNFTTRTSGTTEHLTDLTTTAIPSHKLIAVGENGTILSSLDAETWNARSSGTTSTLNAITPFLIPPATPIAVAVGTKGTVLTSDDGTTWKSRSSGTTSSILDASPGIPVFPSDPLLAAVGENGLIITSPDGVTWTPRTSGTTADLNGVSRLATGFVAVGDFGTILSSANGITWNTRTSNTTTDLRSVTWTGTQAVAVGQAGTILTSPDGIDWTHRYSPIIDPTEGAIESEHLRAVTAASPDLLVAVGFVGTVLTSHPSVDFADWIAHESPPPGQDGPDDDPNGDDITNLVAYGHGIPAVAPTTADDLAALPRMLPPGPDGRLRLQLRVNTLGLGDLSYILEQSTSLEPGSWTEIFRQDPGQPNPTFPFPAHITSDGPDGTVIIELIEESVGARPAYFTRLRHELSTP